MNILVKKIFICYWCLGYLKNETMGNYHDIYLETYILSLAEVLEKFIRAKV